MNFTSTRNPQISVSLSTALQQGLAPDGGLYVPTILPHFEAEQWKSDLHGSKGLADVAEQLLTPFFAGDALSSSLHEICHRAFSFDAPLLALDKQPTYILQLFHGPTAAFKDFGARFLAESLELAQPASSPRKTILVATSGDTGAAVGAAFHQRTNFSVVILYPRGRVSERQEHGLGCFGDNVIAARVDGNFDACQSMVKAALSDVGLVERFGLSSANSISLGRLLPQIAYFARAALQFWQSHREILNVCVPTGNLGNGLACVLAKQMGLPIGDIIFATNANRVLPDFFSGSEYRATASIPTLANAMDVGAPSNFERLRWFLPNEKTLRASFRAFRVDDSAIKKTIANHYETFGQIICPHTATSAHVVANLRGQGDLRPWAIVATAHPAKFETIVEPLIGKPVEVPSQLASALLRPFHAEDLKADNVAFETLLNTRRRAGY